MVGSNTVLMDHPSLTVRLAKKGQRRKNPARAVLDSKLVIPPTAKIFKNAGRSERVFVFTSKSSSTKKQKALEAKGVEVITIPVTKTGLSVRAALKALAKRSMSSVLIEGGSALATSALRAKLVDKIYWYTAPVIIGGDGGPSVGELGIKKITDKLVLKRVTQKKLGADILTIGYV
jgi:diaminohydroxyphosphoribosylaminopyrimidine deaminase/5-amino-6-(5-phosphoribosylamino)uracil reductase